MNKNIKKRIQWIDSLKGLTILLIVLGHTTFPGKNILFWFHVPIFFLLSGLTINFDLNYKSFLSKKINSLLIPYLTFGILIIILTFFTIDLSLNAMLKNFILLIYGGEKAKGIIGAFWFVLTLFLSENLLYFIAKRSTKKFSFVIIIILYSIAYLIINNINHHYTLPWNILAIPYATLFIFIGYYFKTKLQNFDKNLLSLSVIIFILNIIYLILTKNNFVLDTKYLVLNNYVLDITIPLSISVILIQIFILTENIISYNPLSKIGTYSLTIMFFHNYFIQLISLFISKNWIIEFLSSSVLSILVSIIIYKTKIKNILFLKLKK